ncbi:GNAT family N-acetyltransferase [Clostridium intestinale]|uniref:GNAT family N-acetyltransferase n=1 Tax=Clostridium intestinale TaxID=36845 RepID=UPI0028E53965|nr:GNAT family N-acetyltransferase [Clostridium intestinale]
MLNTDRCVMNKINKNDYEDVKKLYFDERVREFLGGVVTKKRYNNIFEEMLSANEESIYLTVRNNTTDELVGLVSLDKHHDGVSTEISYQFVSEFWGQGYGNEVIKKLMDYAFKELNLNKLVAETQKVNKASCRLLTKLGMSIEESIYRFGAEQNIFRILRDEYYKNN